MSDEGRPMLIIIAHRILIGTAICFGVFYTAWEVARLPADPARRRHLVIAVISAVITLALAYYLKNLRRFVSHS